MKCIVIIAMCIFLAGCAGDVAVKEPMQEAGDESAGAVLAGHGAAFGRLVLVEDGKEQDLTRPFLAEWSVALWLRSLQSDEVERFAMRAADGRFHWNLKPGEYAIGSMIRASAPGVLTRLWMTFSVPEPGQAAYIGQLRLEIDQGRMRVRVADAFDEEAKRAAARLAKAGQVAVKALMQHERPTGTYRGVISICAQSIGLDCSGRYKGLQAVLPEYTADSYPTTESRRPILEWKPARGSSVTYDVAIYDTYSAGVVDLPGTLRHRGKLVAYAQALTEPRYQPSMPLPPGKKFMWSVRMRQDDVVTTWTTSSYFVFFIIGARHGSNQWYGFETPDR